MRPNRFIYDGNAKNSFSCPSHLSPRCETHLIPLRVKNALRLFSFKSLQYPFNYCICMYEMVDVRFSLRPN